MKIFRKKKIRKIMGENDDYYSLLALQMRLDQKAELFKHTILKDITIMQVHQQHKKVKQNMKIFRKIK